VRLDHKKLLKGGWQHPPRIEQKSYVRQQPTNHDNAIESDRSDKSDGSDWSKRETRKRQEFLCGYAERATPVPIPNTEVKPLRADGTARVTVWESRSPQGI
jgi:hypothetical protein